MNAQITLARKGLSAHALSIKSMHMVSYSLQLSPDTGDIFVRKSLFKFKLSARASSKFQNLEGTLYS